MSWELLSHSKFVTNNIARKTLFDNKIGKVVRLRNLLNQSFGFQNNKGIFISSVFHKIKSKIF